MSSATTDTWVEARKASIPTRKDFAATMFDHEVTKYWGIVHITNRISKNLTGHNVKKLRKLFGIIGKKTPRDKMDTWTLLKHIATEKKATEVVNDNNIRGDAACLYICDEISKNVNQAIESIQTGKQLVHS
jgi:hypothetical protein